MNTKVLRTLEYDRIISLLTDEADSKPGKERTKALVPIRDLKEIETWQSQTADALSRVIKNGSTSFGGNHDLRYIVKTLETGASLSATDLLQVASQLENAARLVKYGESSGGGISSALNPANTGIKHSVDQEKGASSERESDESFTDSLSDLFSMLSPLPSLSEEIRRCILSEEEIADDASPELKKIRRQIGLSADKIHSTLTQMINGSCRTYLQEAVITMRDGRYCIPVKSEYKSQVPGMIHDQSSTGSTYFIEPASVVNLNNDIKTLMRQEQEEIEKILADLSAKCGLHTEEIKVNQETETELDFIFARGKLALKMDASRPAYNRKHYLVLKQARHPLIDRKKVVPTDINLGRDFDQLVITGPNTGGKTVSLKTVGLLCLMGQSGLHIPAKSHSELCIFNDIFADIGDEQSIEQSLSTFSSHMVNIVEILKKADRHSLCLFDELGAGTDPSEGAALAVSILEHMHKLGIRTMATTHYSEIKIFALRTEGVENACCEFNVETLSPTYRLLIGVPGKSNAFAISSKLGLPGDIIEEAKKHLDSDAESFEDIIQNLQQSRIESENERKEIAEYKEKIRTLQDQLHNKNVRIDEQKAGIIRRANDEASRILEEAKEIADRTIRNMQKAGITSGMADLEKERTALREKINSLAEKEEANKKASSKKQPSADPSKLTKGVHVLITSLGMKGVVQTEPDAKGELFVMCGSMRMQVKTADLKIDYNAVPEEKPSGTFTGSIKMDKSMNVSAEINLLGMTTDEALAAVSKYLDDAYVAHISPVRIVHGKGTGALRKAVHSYLRKQKNIDEFRLGEYGEGDAGVTIVKFK
ncbi:MAG: endonuclease MutS2 [Lachnospiraceae bacterium]|nr:endonuclease MutS2 [Lachnospiraceae bacterium]